MTFGISTLFFVLSVAQFLQEYFGGPHEQPVASHGAAVEEDSREGLRDRRCIYAIVYAKLIMPLYAAWLKHTVIITYFTPILKSKFHRFLPTCKGYILAVSKPMFATTM